MIRSQSLTLSGTKGTVTFLPQSVSRITLADVTLRGGSRFTTEIPNDEVFCNESQRFDLFAEVVATAIDDRFFGPIRIRNLLRSAISVGV
jgi:hypothetical protein